MPAEETLKQLQWIIERQDAIIGRYESVLLIISLVSSVLLAMLAGFIYLRIKDMVVKAADTAVRNQVGEMTDKRLGEHIQKWEQRYLDLDRKLTDLTRVANKHL